MKKDTGMRPKRIAFIQNITEQLFGYMHLSSNLKHHGHNVDVFVENLEKDILSSLVLSCPDIIVFSCVTGNMKWGLSIFKKYKEINPNCLTIAGGPHPTYFPAMVLENGVDVICRGESEEALLDVCNLYNNTFESIAKINNLSFEIESFVQSNPLRPLVVDLDSLPPIDRTIYDKYAYYRKLNTLPVMVSRGCPFNCTFCYSHISQKLYAGLGQFVRFRSISKVIEELTELKMKSPHVEYLVFNDSTFNANPKWMMSFLKEYKSAINIPFFCSLRADIVTKSQVDALSDANCHVVCFGVEGGSYRLRKELLGRDITDDKLILVSKMLQQSGISVSTTNIFALPTETLDESFALIELNKKIKPRIMAASVFQPYPGTELARISLEKGLISELDSNSCKTYYNLSILKQPDIIKQQRLHKLASYYVYYPFLKPFWDLLFKFSPYNILYYMFLVSLVVNVKKGYGYSWLRIIRYCIFNFKVFSSGK